MAAYDQPGFRGPTPSSPGGFDQRSGAAPGTAGDTGSAADDTGAGAVTLPSGAWQEGARYPATTSGTLQPDQTDVSPISPGPQDDYSDTGAASGRAGHWKRYGWQQPDGG